ncbi:MAG TPA: DUF3857 domain-containing protein [Candidatus Acidoferrales bacterium]|nr:DUF3857 domain-containing protein [Candidatus Acidoferrales bacterium]
MALSKHFLPAFGASFVLSALSLFLLFAGSRAQTPPPKSPPPETLSKDAAEPASIELLETRVRFEADGSSRREIHAIVRIHSEAGAGQFSRLSFDYNRAFEQVDLPLLRVTHSNGGTADILPSAIVDQPNPAVAEAPAYQDVRRKSVHVLGLQAGDVLEYRILTKVSHPPFAPEFYFSHEFARDAVNQETLEIDLPAVRAASLRTSVRARSYETEKPGGRAESRIIYRWRRPAPDSEKPAAVADLAEVSGPSEPDVSLTTFTGWPQLLLALQKAFSLNEMPVPEVLAKAEQLTRGATQTEERLDALYQFVSQKIRTVDLPLGSTGFRMRSPGEILATDYAIPEEKCRLLTALAGAIRIPAAPAFPVAAPSTRVLPRPSLLLGILLLARIGGKTAWLDPSTGVTPFRMIPAIVRSKPALLLAPTSDLQFFADVPSDPPFPATQKVHVAAAITADGKLTAKVRYVLRGDNELLLRVVFHRTPKEQWKEVAALLSVSDGFRGQITSVNASDPSSTREPFRLEYEISQPKFVDWSKPPVRIPALLPLLGLPEISAKPAAPGEARPIDLGTPLEIEAESTVQLPPGTEARTPAGTSVRRDYAAYASSYTVQDAAVRASRHLKFILREVPGDRFADYAGFVRAVENDEAQEFTLVRSAPTAAPASAPRKSAAGPPQP